ncbi:Mob1/phocein, partial [Clavulina sp. PMI_390]
MCLSFLVLAGTRVRTQDTSHAPSAIPPLATLDSSFQLQEYIALLIKSDPHDVERIISLPTSHHDDDEDELNAAGSSAEDDKPVDEQCWIYEQLRRVAQDLSYPLLSALQLECNRMTCPEMKADEWLYLCVAHGNGVEQQCCAIDYIVHTLDSTNAVLNSPKSFPSRLSIPHSSKRHFHSLARRLSRIFAHAYYHHREAFETCEAETSLYHRFYLLARKHDLVPAEFLIPP